MKISLALLAALLFAAFSLAATTCTPTGSTPTNCVASYPDDAGPTDVCDITFTCDSGNFGLSCVLVGGDNFSCTCGTDVSGLSSTLPVNRFVCDAEGALVAANGLCGWGLQLAQ